MNNGIIITNANKLTEAIKAAEMRTRTRKITSEDVIKGCSIAEVRMGIPRKHMDGVTISVDMNAQKFPNCYNGIPESTQFDAINRKGKWYVTKIYRSRCRYAGHEVEIKLTDAAKAHVIKRVEGFTLV
jgi:hypothetical protein